MLQRPQTLVFIAAAIITIIAAFSPLASYSPNYKDAPARVIKRAKKSNPQIVVSTNGVDYRMNYVDDLPISKKKFEKSMEEANVDLDKAVEERKINIMFLIGMIGTVLLGMCIIGLIFLFKHRKLQIRFGIGLFLITLAVAVGIFIGSKIGLELFAEFDIIPRSFAKADLIVSYKYGFFLFPIVAVLLLISALLVRRDDNLVKSLDRLR